MSDIGITDPPKERDIGSPTEGEDERNVPEMPKTKKARTSYQSGFTVKTIMGEIMEVNYCVYRRELNQYVFIPSGYGKRYYSRNKEKPSAPFCCHCRLQPCLNVEFSSELFGYGRQLTEKLSTDVMSDREKAQLNHGIGHKLMKVAAKIMKSIFGGQYAKRNGIPRCVFEKILVEFPVIGEAWYESSENEDDETKDGYVSMQFIPPFYPPSRSGDKK